jgi:RNA polymerase sporulation-specific sigma factor
VKNVIPFVRLSQDDVGSGFALPLSKEKEKAYFEALERGDKDALETLVMHNMRLVVHVVKRYQGVADNDEIISIGSMGLLKAIHSFKVERGTQFSTYAAKCIENEILMYLRWSKHDRQNVSLYAPVGVDKEGNEVTFIDTLYQEGEDIGKAVECEETKRIVYRVIAATLTDREKRIIISRYGLFDRPVLSQRQIAEREGISRSYISRIEKKALGKMRAYCEANGLTDIL